MEIDIHNEELARDATLVERHAGTETTYGVRLYLKSVPEVVKEPLAIADDLHFITFWWPTKREAIGNLQGLALNIMKDAGL